MEPWRIVASVFVILIMSLVLSPLPSSMAMPVVPLVFLLCVGFCTSMADWVGGTAAAITALICLDLIFLGRAGQLDAFTNATTLAVIITFAIICTLGIILIERMKYDRANARLEAASLRAANTALSAVEIAAAQRPPGDREAYLDVLSKILTAMARMNRASAGAIGPTRFEQLDAGARRNLRRRG